MTPQNSATPKIHVTPKQSVTPKQNVTSKQSVTAGKGPRFVFFSGGTALSPIARCLAEITHNASYIMTPFDSGGSSAILRQTFSMPAIGDFRARIISLINPQIAGYKDIKTLFQTRFPHAQATPYTSPENLQDALQSLANNMHPLIKPIPDLQSEAFLKALRTVYEALFPDKQHAEPSPKKAMSLHYASLGNLILTGAYLLHNRSLTAMLKEYSALLQLQGNIHPSACVQGAQGTPSIHLCARLEDGSLRLGQHSFTNKDICTCTGKDAGPLQSPIKNIWLTQSLEDSTPVHVEMSPDLYTIITKADFICYPIGSFYSSVIANLLPKGITKAVASAACPKVFIPNICEDPELYGQSLQSQLIHLLEYAKPEANTPTKAVLSTMLVDIDASLYAGGIPHTWLEEQGIAVCQTSLTNKETAPCIDTQKVCEALQQLYRASASRV